MRQQQQNKILQARLETVTEPPMSEAEKKVAAEAAEAAKLTAGAAGVSCAAPMKSTSNRAEMLDMLGTLVKKSDANRMAQQGIDRLHSLSFELNPNVEFCDPWIVESGKTSQVDGDVYFFLSPIQEAFFNLVSGIGRAEANGTNSSERVLLDGLRKITQEPSKFTDAAGRTFVHYLFSLDMSLPVGLKLETLIPLMVEENYSFSRPDRDGFTGYAQLIANGEDILEDWELAERYPYVGLFKGIARAYQVEHPSSRGGILAIPMLCGENDFSVTLGHTCLQLIDMDYNEENDAALKEIWKDAYNSFEHELSSIHPELFKGQMPDANESLQAEPATAKGELEAAKAEAEAERATSLEKSMFEAIEEGQSDKVSELLASRSGLCDVVDERGSTPLALAVCRGHSGIVASLLDAGAGLDVRSCGSSALELAVMGRHVDVCEILVARYKSQKLSHPEFFAVDVDADAGANCLMYGLVREGSNRILKSLFELPGADSASKEFLNDLLFRAASPGNIEAFKLFLDSGAECDAVLETEDDDALGEGKSILLYAMTFARDRSFVNELLRRGATAPEFDDALGDYHSLRNQYDDKYKECHGLDADSDVDSDVDEPMEPCDAALFLKNMELVGCEQKAAALVRWDDFHSSHFALDRDVTYMPGGYQITCVRSDMQQKFVDLVESAKTAPDLVRRLDGLVEDPCGFTDAAGRTFVHYLFSLECFPEISIQVLMRKMTSVWQNEGSRYRYSFSTPDRDGFTGYTYLFLNFDTLLLSARVFDFFVGLSYAYREEMAKNRTINGLDNPVIPLLPGFNVKLDMTVNELINPVKSNEQLEAIFRKVERLLMKEIKLRFPDQVAVMDSSDEETDSSDDESEPDLGRCSNSGMYSGARHSGCRDNDAQPPTITSI